MTAKRDGDHDHLAEPSGVRGSHRPSPPTPLLDHSLEGLRPSGVADRDLVPRSDEVSGQRSPDVPCPDDAESHALFHSQERRPLASEPTAGNAWLLPKTLLVTVTILAGNPVGDRGIGGGAAWLRPSTWDRGPELDDPVPSN